MGNQQCVSSNHAVFVMERARRAASNSPLLMKCRKVPVTSEERVANEISRGQPSSYVEAQYDVNSSSSSPASLPYDGDDASLPIMRESASHDSIMIEYAEEDKHEEQMMETRRPRIDFSRIPEDHPYLFRPIHSEQPKLNFGVDPGFVAETRRHFRPRRHRPELMMQAA